MATFYTGVDKERYDLGDKFLPMDQFLLNYKTPGDGSVENDTFRTPKEPYGIPYTNAFTNSAAGGGALQTNDPMMNWDNFYNYTGNKWAQKQPTPFLDATYDQKIQDKFFGKPTWEQDVTGADAGEYLAANQDIPLALTGAGKMKQGWENAKEGIASIGDLSPIRGFFNAIDQFHTLSPVDQNFIQTQMGYTGPTVFGENTSGLSKDPFGLNVRSGFGNYAEAVGSNFDQLRNTLTKDRDGATFNEETGLFEGVNADAINKQTKLIRTKYNFRKKQLDHYNKIGKDYQNQQDVMKADVARTQDKVDERAKMLNELASEKDVKDAGGNVIASTVNPAVDPSYHGGTANPHTDTGWSGSKQGGTQAKGGAAAGPAKQRDYSTHEAYGLKEGGRIYLNLGGLASIL